MSSKIPELSERSYTSELLRVCEQVGESVHSSCLALSLFGRLAVDSTVACGAASLPEEPAAGLVPSGLNSVFQWLYGTYSATVARSLSVQVI